jgi:transposase
MVEPRYPQRAAVPSLLDPYREQLSNWLKTDSYRGKRDRRSVRAYFESIRAMGFTGSKNLVYNFCSDWRQAQANAPRNAGYVPLSFELGEAFQFDWSCEYVVIGGLRKRLEVAHTKLAASRAFVLVAYFTQSHEMLFDAHTKAFEVFGGVPKRGIYDNMRTAVDKVGKGKERSVNARFESMTGHYLCRTGAGTSGAKRPRSAGAVLQSSTHGCCRPARTVGLNSTTRTGPSSPWPMSCRTSVAD